MLNGCSVRYQTLRKKEFITLCEHLCRLLLRDTLDSFEYHFWRVRHRLNRVESAINEELDIPLGETVHTLSFPISCEFILNFDSPIVPQAQTMLLAHQDHRLHPPRSQIVTGHPPLHSFLWLGTIKPAK